MICAEQAWFVPLNYKKLCDFDVLKKINSLFLAETEKIAKTFLAFYNLQTCALICLKFLEKKYITNSTYNYAPVQSMDTNDCWKLTFRKNQSSNDRGSLEFFKQKQQDLFEQQLVVMSSAKLNSARKKRVALEWLALRLKLNATKKTLVKINYRLS